MSRRLCAWGLLGALLTLPLLGCNLGTRLGGQTVAAGSGGGVPAGDDTSGEEATAAAPAVREQSAFLLESGVARREKTASSASLLRSPTTASTGLTSPSPWRCTTSAAARLPTAIPSRRPSA